MRLAPVLLGAGLAAAIGWDVHSGSTPQPSQIFTVSGRTEPRLFPCTVASIDGPDRFTCAERGDNGRQIRLRLAGVDAAGTGEACAAGLPCAAARAARAEAALAGLALGRRLSCQADGPHGRTVTFCRRPDGVDLSCAMLAGKHVARSDRGWEAHDCPS